MGLGLGFERVVALVVVGGRVDELSTLALALRAQLHLLRVRVRVRVGVRVRVSG